MWGSWLWSSSPWLGSGTGVGAGEAIILVLKSEEYLFLANPANGQKTEYSPQEKFTSGFGSDSGNKG